MTLDRIRGLRLGSDGRASTKSTDPSIAEAQQQMLAWQREIAKRTAQLQAQTGGR